MNNRLALAALAISLLPSALSAQDFDASLGAAASAAARQVKAAVQSNKPIFPTMIDCRPDHGSGLPADLRFYTRLEAVQSVAQIPPTQEGFTIFLDDPKKDETAAQLDDYRSARINRSAFRYDLWSCDTQDFYFAFPTDGLVRQSPVQSTKPVTGRILIEERGSVDYKGEMDCTAFYK